MQSQYIKIKVNHKRFTVPSAALQDNTNETIKQLQLITVAFQVRLNYLDEGEAGHECQVVWKVSIIFETLNLRDAKSPT